MSRFQRGSAWDAILSVADALPEDSVRALISLHDAGLYSECLKRCRQFQAKATRKGGE